jgi:hypothetical protein
MPRIERSVGFAMPPEDVQEYLSTPSRMSEWLVGFSARGELPAEPAEQGTAFKATIAMAGVSFDVNAVYLEHIPARRDVLQFSGVIRNTLTLLYETIEDGYQVTGIIDYEVPLSALGHIVDMLVIEQLNARNLERSLENARIILGAEPPSLDS